MTKIWSLTEDGRAGTVPQISEHQSGLPDEFVQWSCRVRIPWQWQPRERLVIRAYAPYADADAAVTVALEVDKE